MTSISDKIARRVAERNSWSTYSPKTFKDVFKMLRENRPDKTLPNETWLNKNFPVKNVDWESLRNYPNSSTTKNSIQATWIGHATVFVQMGKFKILTDPIFSDRCSGVQWAGPKRYRPPACTLQELIVKEKIGVDVVLISHNHYDHLDYNSVKELAQLAISQNQPIEFVVPLGLRKWFEKHIPLSLKGGNKVTELDWHESYVIRKESNNEMCLSVTPVPMQHWSNRYGYDRDLTLWCGFSVKAFHENNNSNNDDGSKSCSFLFTGDTGLFDEATKIGQQYGPFDLAAIPSKFFLSQ